MSLIKNATAPSWVKEAVFYQIFPDRFAKSDHYKGPGKYDPGEQLQRHIICVAVIFLA